MRSGFRRREVRDQALIDCSGGLHLWHMPNVCQAPHRNTLRQLFGNSRVQNDIPLAPNDESWFVYPLKEAAEIGCLPSVRKIALSNRPQCFPRAFEALETLDALDHRR